MRGTPLAVAVVFALLPSTAAAERLPIRAYTTADGLAHNAVNKIVRDSRGFLWFATNDGLSRFDGYTFSNYSTEQGLPHRRVMDLLQTKHGELWVATFGGLVRFHPDGTPADDGGRARDSTRHSPMFVTIVPADPDPRALVVISLLETRDGTIWCGTRNGLYRLARDGERSALQPVDLGIPTDVPESSYVNDLLEDGDGSVWAATPSGLYRRRSDGGVARYTEREGLPSNFLHDLLLDHHGRIWVASRYAGFFRIAQRRDGSPVIAEHYQHKDGLPSSWIFSLAECSDGRFWVATNVGLVEFLDKPAAGKPPFLAYTRHHGLSHQEITTFGEDGGGNLWIGTATSGSMKLVRNGFVTYGHRDAIATANEVFDDASGAVYVNAAVFGRWSGERGGTITLDGEYVLPRYGRFSGRGFDWFMPAPPYWPAAVPQAATVRTMTGDWWLATATGPARYTGLRRFDDMRTAPPTKVYVESDGVPAPQIYRQFADSRGDVWFSLVSPSKNGFVRWERATERLCDMAASPGYPPIRDSLPRAFGEDAAGTIWVGLDVGVARYSNGTFTVLGIADGLPAGSIVDIHTDSAGRLWLASSRGGLIRVDNPEAERPAFLRYTTADGLSGNSIEIVAEDLYGRIYAATGRGVDQLDPVTGRVRQFTGEDGLAPGTMLTAFRDRDGALWFGTQNGLSRLMPAAPVRSAAPVIFITRLTAGGESRPVSAIGATSLSLPDLPSGANQLQIEFASLRFTPGERLRYQYRLDGSQDDWGPLTARRSVSYASLAPGRYRFLVRAVNADGVPSPDPAAVEFTVLPPLWLRWWFLTLAAAAATAAAIALHRYRLGRILELERVRTRIATDLHDDVGANLTRIAILSEVTRQQGGGGTRNLDAPLSSIAEIARESVATMSDIVWAISPGRDTLRDMVRRMRDHAEELFESRDIRLLLDMPDAAQAMRLGVDVRRDVYLVFKEAVNNAVRHSGCSAVAVVLRVDGPVLWLEVTDNGNGFETSSGGSGNGLASMQRRAARLGASLDVISAPQLGTTVRLRMTVPEWRATLVIPTRTSR